MGPFLKAAELLYRGINRARRAAYGRGYLHARHLPRPVISVGNLAAGGTGKTPMVIHVASYLVSRGMRVAVLTRGYGRGDARATGLVEPGTGALLGDEPAVIKKRVPGAAVIVGRYRFLNAMSFLKHNQCDVFILDDGFQHLQLARDADVVIVGQPGSFCREGPSALADAHLVVYRDRTPPPGAYRMSLRLGGTDQLHGRRLLAFCGLAHNDSFFRALRERGLETVATLGFADHHSYSDHDIESIERRAREAGADAIVTTEKDAVKLGGRDIIALPAEVVIEPEPAFFAALLSLIQAARRAD